MYIKYKMDSIQVKWLFSFIGFFILIELIFSTIFYILIPGVFMTLPKDGSKNTINITHTGIFSAIFVLLFITNVHGNFKNPKFIIFTILSILYVSTLFYGILPGVLTTIPMDISKTNINVIHSGVFGTTIILSFFILYALTSGK